jgi:hypothetical protein
VHQPPAQKPPAETPAAEQPAQDSPAPSLVSTSVVLAAINAPPSVKLARPSSGSAFGSNVCMGATASDDVGVTKVEFRLDGRLVATDAKAPYAAAWNVPSKTSYASHTLSATAYDAAGLKTKTRVTVKRTKSAARCATTAAAKRAGVKRAAIRARLR